MRRTCLLCFSIQSSGVHDSLLFACTLSCVTHLRIFVFPLPLFADFRGRLAPFDALGRCSTARLCTLRLFTAPTRQQRGSGAAPTASAAIGRKRRRRRRRQSDAGPVSEDKYPSISWRRHRLPSTFSMKLPLTANNLHGRLRHIFLPFFWSDRLGGMKGGNT